MPLHDDHGPGFAGTTGERIGVVERARVSNGKLKDGPLGRERLVMTEAAVDYADTA